jgi:hypothetical protein
VDTSKIFTLGLVGVGSYMLYQHFTAAPVAAAAGGSAAGGSAPAGTAPAGQSATPPASSGGGAQSPAAPAPVPAPPPPIAFNSLDAIYGRLSTAVGSTPLTADGFNYYLARVLPANITPPDPLAVFTSPTWNREGTMTLANYWGAMAPYLRDSLGLSGLGFYGGLGVYLRGSW